MPAVLSKQLARLPLEDFYAARRQVSSVVSVPVAALRTVVLEKRITPPALAWSSYSTNEGIEDPELAQELLALVNPLTSEALEKLVSEGHDRTSVIYWVLDEAVHALKKVLNNATSDLREIWQNAAIGEKRWRRARKRLETFLKAIANEVDKGRSLACWSCQKPVDTGSLCGLCRRARYCSERCQKDDWKTHRQMCTGYARVAKA